MTKIINLIIAATLAISMAACGGDDAPDPEPPAPVTPAPDPEPEPAPDPSISPDFAAAPVNPSASAETKALYAMLLNYSGKNIISGAMANVNNNNDFASWVTTVTSKTPALCGYDFIHLPESPANWIDYSDITPARQQWSSGGIVSYMWHWRAPSSESDWTSGNFNAYGYGMPGKDSPTDFDIREALKEGTWQNRFLIADIDRVADYLRLLADAGIPVLWRPLHEAAGSYQYGPWFWWGRYGDDYTISLWRMLYDRLVKHHGLNNLIWVWTAQYQPGYADRMAASYPGDEYVDIVGVDLYQNNTGSQADAYQAALSMTSGRKMVALSECGLIPDPQKCIAEGAPWAWFMLWYSYDIHKSGQTTDNFGNSASWLRSVMQSDIVISRDEMRH